MTNVFCQKFKTHSRNLALFVGKLDFPAGKLDFPGGKLIFPGGKLDFPGGKLYFPDGKLFFPLGKLDFPDGKWLSPDGKLFFPVGGLFPLDEALLLLRRNSELNACSFGVVGKFFEGHSVQVGFYFSFNYFAGFVVGSCQCSVGISSA